MMNVIHNLIYQLVKDIELSVHIRGMWSYLIGFVW